VSDRATVPVAVGDIATFRKTVGESDVYLLAGIMGDVASHVLKFIAKTNDDT
jgi:hypothetical protein